MSFRPYGVSESVSYGDGRYESEPSVVVEAGLALELDPVCYCIDSPCDSVIHVHAEIRAEVRCQLKREVERVLQTCLHSYREHESVVERMVSEIPFPVVHTVLHISERESRAGIYGP